MYQQHYFHSDCRLLRNGPQKRLSVQRKRGNTFRMDMGEQGLILFDGRTPAPQASGENAPLIQDEGSSEKSEMVEAPETNSEIKVDAAAENDLKEKDDLLAIQPSPADRRAVTYLHEWMRRFSRA